SAHPLASALATAAAQRGLPLASVSDFASRPGRGVLGRVSKRRVAVGNMLLFEDEGIDASSVSEEAERFAGEGKTVLFVAADKKLLGLLAVSDPLKPASRHAVERLQELGLDVAMLTGDREAAARAVAAELGIREVFAGVLPAEK